MAQQAQTQDRAALTERQEDRSREEQARQPERARPGGAGLAARLAAEGVPLYALPPERLEELAGTLGNSAMQALLDAQAPPLREARFQMPEAEPGTAPFPVPEGRPCALARPAGLTAAAEGSA